MGDELLINNTTGSRWWCNEVDIEMVGLAACCVFEVLSCFHGRCHSNAMMQTQTHFGQGIQMVSNIAIFIVPNLQNRVRMVNQSSTRPLSSLLSLEAKLHCLRRHNK